MDGAADATGALEERFNSSCRVADMVNILGIVAQAVVEIKSKQVAGAQRDEAPTGVQMLHAVVAIATEHKVVEHREVAPKAAHPTEDKARAIVDVDQKVEPSRA